MSDPTPNASGMRAERGAPRRGYRPPVGVPLERARPWGTPVSVLVHLAILLLLLGPALRSPTIAEIAMGAGGPGPAGGGGGGARGAGGRSAPQERLRFVEVAAPAPKPAPALTMAKPVTPRVKPPAPTPQPVTPPPVPPAVKVEAPPAPTQLALAPVTGAGTGSDGSNGTGPGTGGGVGTGNGTGRGSGEGPGTGGGTGTIYPATPEFLVMPSLPVPKRVQGRTLELRFTIDEHGKIVKVEFESSGDSGYDRQLRERLSEYRFRPAHRMDGTPVPSVYVTQLTL